MRIVLKLQFVHSFVTFLKLLNFFYRYFIICLQLDFYQLIPFMPVLCWCLVLVRATKEKRPYERFHKRCLLKKYEKGHHVNFCSSRLTDLFPRNHASFYRNHAYYCRNLAETMHIFAEIMHIFTDFYIFHKTLENRRNFCE